MGEMPSWMAGSGVGGDMKGDPRPGAGASLRFWMPQGTEREIVFLSEGGDDVPIIWEHRVRLGGDYRNWATCLQPIGEKCPLCAWADAHDGESARRKTMIFTVIDTQEFTDKSGNKHKNKRRLMCCASEKIAEILFRKWKTRDQKGESLRGAKFNVFRSKAEKSSAIGEDFEFVEMVDLANYPETDPLDYEMLKPDPEAMQRLMERLRAERQGTSGSERQSTDGGASQQDAGGSAPDGEVPF